MEEEKKTWSKEDVEELSDKICSLDDDKFKKFMVGIVLENNLMLKDIERRLISDNIKTEGIEIEVVRKNRMRTKL